MSAITITSTRKLRIAFWRDHPHLERRPGRQNDQPADTRMAWVDYVDHMHRSGLISERLANSTTL